MKSQFVHVLLSVMLSTAACLVSHSSTAAEAAAEVAAQWRSQQVLFSYQGETQYECESFRKKVINILRTLGAHPATQIRGDNCTMRGPLAAIDLQILTAIPVPVEAQAPPPPSDRESLQQLGVSPSNPVFGARMETVRVKGKSPGARQIGDCELIEQLGKKLLPDLGMQIVQQSTRCTPGQLQLTKPILRVRVLIASTAPDPDRQ